VESEHLLTTPTPVIVYLPPKPQPLGPRSVKSSFRLGERRYEELRYEDADVVAQSTSREVEEDDQYMRSIKRNEQYHTPTTLAVTAGAVVVQINYRALTYPQPVHDVLAGWDWVVKTVKDLQDGSSAKDTGLAGARSTRDRDASSIGIGVYGELVGGSLGVMLGLTECDASATGTAASRSSDYSWATNKARITPSDRGNTYVKAVATRDAIVDWVFPPPTPSSAAISSTDVLQNLRDDMFRAQSHPSTYFDPFASPIHFLRTPSAALPSAVHIKEDNHNKSSTSKSKSEEFELLARLEDETARALQPTMSSYSLASSLSSQPVAVDDEENLSHTTSNAYDAELPAAATVISTVDIDMTQRRKVPLRWPPSSLPQTMRMPNFLLTVGHAADVSPSTASSPAASATTSTRKTTKRHTPPSPSDPLLQQNEEMTRLLRRSWVKYCMLYESNQESLTKLMHGSNASDIHIGATKESAKLDPRVMKGLFNSGDRLLDRLILKGLMDEKAGDEAEADDGGYSSHRSGYADDGEEQELQAQAKEVQARVKVKVQYEVVGKEELQLKRVGEWLGASLRR